MFILVTDMLLEAMDNKQLSIVILLDMSKAFDSVDHNMLLQRILNLGVSSAVHKWFKSYLSDRWQYVRIGTTSSAPVALSYGIPQGSVLSPFLFNIYTDSLSSVPNSCSLESYVDDSKTFLSFSLSHMEHSLLHIEEDLHIIFEWCCNNSLLVNPPRKDQNVGDWYTATHESNANFGGPFKARGPDCRQGPVHMSRVGHSFRV